MKSKEDYHKKLEGIISELKEKNSAKPKLLLHACCGPCSSYVLEFLADHFEITVFYYNPNIYPPEEYERRLKELEVFLSKFPKALKENVKLVECSYDPNEFYQAVGVNKEPELAKEAERGERCRRCYDFRMKKAFEYASDKGFDYFTTTLSISPYKDAEKINTIGYSLVDLNSGTKYLPADFKKKNGFLRSLQISEEYNLYRQDYCGCIFSKQNTEEERSKKHD